MIDPPSAKLTQTLEELQLCTSRDLRRARPLVKRLSRDLPAFDSIWLDSLVQLNVLTPYQAKALEPARSEPIQIGDNLLLEKMSFGKSGCTFRAHPQGKKTTHRAVKQIAISQEYFPSVQERLQKTVQQLAGIQHRHIAVPTACYEHQQQLILESPFVGGHDLGEILVRRGRLPDFLVREIGRQLINGLAELEKRHILHGDLRLSNVKLTSSGDAVLLSPGVRPAVSPELTLNTQMSPDRCDGIAPELIGTGNSISTQSDIYALGCLLWQLLAGRPPFPTGDPLAKLSAHQTKAIPDVRLWAPDTPDDLAKQILVMTHLDTSARASSFQQLQKLWGNPQRMKRKNIRQYLNRFERGILNSSSQEQSSSKLYWTTIVLLLTITGGTSLAFFNQGAVNHLLEMGARKFPALKLPAPQKSQEPTNKSVSNSTDNTLTIPQAEAPNENAVPPTTAHIPVEPSPQFPPLPAPDAYGNIQLTSNGPFLASEITHVGELTIVGITGSQPVILVQDTPLQLTGVKVTLENIHLRKLNSEILQPLAPSAKSLLVVNAEEIVIEECSFNDLAGKPSPPMTGITWNNTSTGSLESQKLQVQNSSFYTRQAAVKSTRASAELVMRNCLKLGSGPLFSIPGSSPANLEFSQSTSRGTDLLVEVQKDGAGNLPESLSLNLESSVVEFSPKSPALFGTMAQEIPPDQTTNWFVTGDDIFAAGDWKFLRHQTLTKSFPEVEITPDQVASINPVDLEFTGKVSTNPRTSIIREGTLNAYPRVNEELPGIKPELIPTLKSHSAGSKKKERSVLSTQVSLH